MYICYTMEWRESVRGRKGEGGAHFNDDARSGV